MAQLVGEVNVIVDFILLVRVLLVFFQYLVILGEFTVHQYITAHMEINRCTKG